MLPPAVQAASPRQTFDPAGAGAVLFTGTGLCMGAGALIGWAVGATGYGALAGVCVGLPTGVFVVYRRFRGYFT